MHRSSRSNTLKWRCLVWGVRWLVTRLFGSMERPFKPLTSWAISRRCISRGASKVSVTWRRLFSRGTAIVGSSVMEDAVLEKTCNGNSFRATSVKHKSTALGSGAQWTNSTLPAILWRPFWSVCFWFSVLLLLPGSSANTWTRIHAPRQHHGKLCWWSVRSIKIGMETASWCSPSFSSIISLVTLLHLAVSRIARLTWRWNFFLRTIRPVKTSGDDDGGSDVIAVMVNAFCQLQYVQGSWEKQRRNTQGSMCDKSSTVCWYG